MSDDAEGLFAPRMRRDKPKPDRREALAPFIIAGALLVVWSFAQMGTMLAQLGAMERDSHPLPGQIGYILGASFFQASLVWAFAYGFFIRRFDPRPARYFFLLLAVPVLLHLAMLTLVKAVVADTLKQEKTAMTELHGVVSSAYNDPDARIDTTPKATGSTGEVERIFRQVMASSVRDSQSLQAELAALDIQTVTSPQRLVSGRDYAGAIATLQKAKTITMDHRARSQRRLAEARSAIRASSMSERQKREMEESMLEGASEAAPNVEHMWDLQESMFDEDIAMIRVLAAADGRWRMEGDKIVFDDDGELRAFNRHALRFAQIQKDFAVTERIRQEGNEQTVKNFAEKARSYD